MKFLLVAYMLSGHGQVDSYVMDSHLSYEDCMIEVLRPLQAVEVEPGVVVGTDRVAMVCELEK